MLEHITGKSAGQRDVPYVLPMNMCCSQACHMAHDIVTEEAVFGCTGAPMPDDIEVSGGCGRAQDVELAALPPTLCHSLCYSGF